MAKRKANAALTRKFETSQELFDLTGKEKLSRPEATKAIWDYAKAEGLNEGNKIRSDDMLAPIIGRGLRGMGEISKGLSAHLLKDD